MRTEIPRINTMRELVSNHTKTLADFGCDQKTISVLAQIFINWQNKTDSLSVAKFRQKFRSNCSEIDWLLDKQLIVARENTRYQPTFGGYTALLVFQKRVASKLRSPIESAIKNARKYLAEDAERSSLSVESFWGETQIVEPQTELEDALTLLSDAGLGIHWNKSQIEPQLIQFNEGVFEPPNFLSYVNWYVNIRFGVNTLAKSMSASQISLELTSFSLQNLLLASDAHSQASKSLRRIQAEPDSSISSAKSALEATFKFIASTEAIELPNNATLAQMLKACSSNLALSTNGVQGLTRAITNLCNELSSLRNAYGDSHGKSPGAKAATRSEAKLIVGTSLLLADYILERWEAARLANSLI